MEHRTHRPLPRSTRFFYTLSTLTGLLLVGAAFLTYHICSSPHTKQIADSPGMAKGLSQSGPLVTATQGQGISTSSAYSLTEHNGSKEFKGFGVTFTIPSKDSKGNSSSAKVDGDKIFVGPASNPEEGGQYAGQYVEVLRKDPTRSLQQVVTSTFIPHAAPTDCKVNVQASGHYQVATINYGADPTKCSVQYVTDENGRYFLMDLDHPGTYLFFQTGQSPLLTSDHPWDSTISINQ